MLQDHQLTPDSELLGNKKEKKRQRRKLTPTQKEAKLRRRRERLVRDQREYSQWRREVVAGDSGSQDVMLDSAIETLWEELFQEQLDIHGLLGEEDYDEFK